MDQDSARRIAQAAEPDPESATTRTRFEGRARAADRNDAEDDGGSE